MKILHTNWLAGLYVLMLLIAALIPIGNETQILLSNYTLQVRADYLVHALFYLPLPVVLLLSGWGRRGGWMPVILLSMAVVVLFETVQMLIPYRTFNINDLIANGIGVFIGLLLFVFFGSRLLKITTSTD